MALERIAGTLSVRAYVLAALLFLAGCATVKLVDSPGCRVGVLPWPGALSMLSVPDPEALGSHRYGGSTSIVSDEEDRGLLYTCHGGFLDLAHVRTSIDWTRYFGREIRQGLSKGAVNMSLIADDPSRYELSFRYPEFWGSLTPGEKTQVIDELSIRLGQRMSWLVSSWHEIITFFGYKSTGLLSEERSSFTYDDMTAHFLGDKVAATALRSTSRDFDSAATLALQQELSRLQIVTKDQVHDALRRIKGHWWSGIRARKRQLQLGLNGEPVVPWLVPGLPYCPNAKPVIFTHPDLNSVLGRDFSGFVEIDIEPRLSEAEQIMALLSPRPQFIRPEEHFPVIMARIKREYENRFGKGVDNPYQDASAAN